MPPERVIRSREHPHTAKNRGLESSRKGHALVQPKQQRFGVSKNVKHRKQPTRPKLIAIAIAVQEVAFIRSAAPSPAPISQPSPAPATPCPPQQVPRIKPIPFDPSNSFMCTANSLYFIHLSELSTTPATETITLNLMDNFLQGPPPFPRELWAGLLHASCFLFACRVTGVANRVEAVARAVEMQARGLAWDGGGGLRVDVEGVERGCRFLEERKEDLRDLLGDFAAERDDEPREMDQDGKGKGAAQEVPLVEHVTFEVKELDFDTYEEPEDVAT